MNTPLLPVAANEYTEYRLGFGLAGSFEWICKAFGRIPEFAFAEVSGFEPRVISKDDALKLNPMCPVQDEVFLAHGLVATGSENDRVIVPVWKLTDPRESALLDELNGEVGYKKKTDIAVSWNGIDIVAAADIIPDASIGRKLLRDDPQLFNESSMKLADIFGNAYFSDRDRCRYFRTKEG